jgi:hypothetical protein
VVFVCSENNTCSSVEFFDDRGISAYGAPFTYNINPQVYAGRAVYYLNTGISQLYLYYYVPAGSTNGIWIVGAVIGQLNGILYAQSQAVVPTGTGVQWFTLTGSQTNPVLTLQCQSALIAAV